MVVVASADVAAMVVWLRGCLFSTFLFSPASLAVVCFFLGSALRSALPGG
jgi:hypothetical protein